MNWLTNFMRPRIRSIVSQKDVPENLWQKCPSCEGMLFHTELKVNSNVCYHCGYHLPISTAERLKILFDNGHYEKIPLPKVPHDPLKFKDRRRYADRLKDAQNKTGKKDALVIAKGTIGGLPVITAAFDFSFMGGSMGVAVGEGIVKAAEAAIENKSALIIIPSSGGARMQEGVLSLMQMPRTIIAVEQVKEAGLPYIVLLTNPTTGGVSASFAMVGDIHIAEPGATIGFAGKRVIEETIREKLPDDFQTAEYLKEHGIVDVVAPRQELHATLGLILDLLMRNSKTMEGKTKSPKANGNGNGNRAKNKAGSKGNAKGSGPMAQVRTHKQAIRSLTKPAANTQNDKAFKKTAR